MLQNKLIEWNNQGAQSNWSARSWPDFHLEYQDSPVINSKVFYFLKIGLSLSRP